MEKEIIIERKKSKSIRISLLIQLYRKSFENNKIFGSEAQLLEISERVEWDFCMGECTIIYDYIGEYTTLKKDILNTL